VVLWGQEIAPFRLRSGLVARRIIVSAVTQWASGLELAAIQAVLTRMKIPSEPKE
jgi:hypothetical protein